MPSEAVVRGCIDVLKHMQGDDYNNMQRRVLFCIPLYSKNEYQNSRY
jgi:hypothetical protein